jgi:hypothetical protein
MVEEGSSIARLDSISVAYKRVSGFFSPIHATKYTQQTSCNFSVLVYLRSSVIFVVPELLSRYSSSTSHQAQGGNSTVDSPHIGNPKIRQVLKVTDFCGRAATPLACGHDIGQVLKATRLPGSGGCPVWGLSTVLLLKQTHDFYSIETRSTTWIIVADWPKNQTKRATRVIVDL